MPLCTSAIAVLGLVVTASSFSVHAGGSRLAPRLCTRRSAAPRAALTPYRQDDTYNYYRIPIKKEVVLSKPFGADLVENNGMVIDELTEGGNAAVDLKKGDIIQVVNGEDVTQMGFDEVMAMLTAAPEQVTPAR